MSSSNGTGFTGTALVLLALFGVGGALMDKARNTGDEAGPRDVAVLDKTTGTIAPDITAAPGTPEKMVVAAGPGSPENFEKRVKADGQSEFVRQKPEFDIINLPDVGPRSIAGTAAPGARIVLDIDGRSAGVGLVDESGNFSLDLADPLPVGKHVLKLKSIGPVAKGPVTSDQRIEVEVTKGRDPVVALLRKGGERQVLQGIEDDPSDTGATPEQNAPERVEKPTIGKTAKAAKEPVDEMADVQPARSAMVMAGKVEGKSASGTQEPAVADKAASNPSPASAAPEWRGLSFTDMKYVAHKDRAGDISVEGMAQAGARIRFLLDGKNIGRSVADKTGAWRLAATGKLAPGAHWLLAEQTDAAGKVITFAESPFDIAEPPRSAKKPQAKPAPEMAKKPDAKPAGTMRDAGRDAGGTAPEKSALEMIAEATREPKNNDKTIAAPSDADEMAGPEAVAKAAPAAESVTPPADEDKKNLWDKFTDMFRVDPANPDGDIAIGARRPAPGARDKTAVAGVKGPSGFAFESLAYRDGNAGGEVVLAGHAPPDSRIRLFRGLQEIGEVVADKKGSWSFVSAGALAPGTHLFRAGHVLASGRIASEVRRQYDHVVPTKLAAKGGNGQPDELIEGGKAGQGGEGRERTKRLADAASPQDALPSTGARAGQKPLTRSAGINRRASPPQGSRRDAKRAVKRRARQGRPASRSGKKYKRKKRYQKSKRVVSVRRSVRKRARGKYYLGRKNKARYMARRKLYPRSRKTPARVRVRKGTTLWGYSEHYYGRGNLYPRIRRANRRKIKKAGRIYIGQRIRVPKLRKKKRRKYR